MTTPSALFNLDASATVNALATEQVSTIASQVGLIFECDIANTFVQGKVDSMSTADIADEADVLVKDSANPAAADGIDVSQFKDNMFNALGSTVLKVVADPDVGTDEVISEVAYSSFFTKNTASAGSDPDVAESLGEHMCKGYINAMLKRGDSSIYDVLVLHPDNSEVLIKDTTTNNYTDASNNDQYSIDKIVTDALFDVANTTDNFSLYNTAFLDILQHGADTSNNALILQNYADGTTVVPFLQNSIIYFKLNLTVNWNGTADVNKTNHGVPDSLQDSKNIIVQDFNHDHTNWAKFSTTLYKEGNQVVDLGLDAGVDVVKSVGGMLIKCNVASANLTFA